MVGALERDTMFSPDEDRQPGLSAGFQSERELCFDRAAS
jgi:hypothetical protein